MKSSVLALVLCPSLALSAAAGDARRTTAASFARRSAPAPASSLPALILPPEPSEHDRLVGEACQRALGHTAGGVVALDPRTGRVLAIVNPTYGLLNAYQPCSVFKIVVAVAGLTEGVITPDTTFTCSKGCWMWPGHGPIDLRRALAVSCNPYFERVGEKLGYEKIQHYAQLLGLGAATGINLAGEAQGKLPSSVRVQDVGHLSSHAAGIATSALQLAVLLSATVNGGVVYQPQVGAAAGFEPKERWRLPAGTVFKGLSDGFLSAVNEGSATNAFDPDVLVAGKTGSCSRVGWFASYAPADQPEIVVVVFLRWGNGHEASTVAGRIYQEVFKTPAPPATVAAGSGTSH
jgi:cell division protein FtsI/penicillin-binding protein 2